MSPTARGLRVVADGFLYPEPDSLDRMRSALAALPTGPTRRALERFADAVEPIGLGAWEELHTRTLDLSPQFVPYVGHVTWGENYRRGAFMADLQAAIRDNAVDQSGELPDHLGAVLRLLAATPTPPADLIEILPSAVAAMRAQLKKADRDNPYRHLLAAAAAAVDGHLLEGATA